MALLMNGTLRNDKKRKNLSLRTSLERRRCGSWKISFPREVASGSTHPTLAGQCLAEIGQAASMDELKHSVFAFVSRNTEFTTLDSKIVRNCEDHPSQIQEESRSSGQHQYKEKRSMLTGGQITHHVFSLVNTDKK